MYLSSASKIALFRARNPLKNKDFFFPKAFQPVTILV